MLEEKLAQKFQFTTEIIAKSIEGSCITSRIQGESPCVSAGSTQDIMQKTEATHTRGWGQRLLLVEMTSGGAWNTF